MATMTKKITPSIINCLSNKAPALSAPDRDGFRFCSYSCRWNDMRGLCTQLRDLDLKGVGKFKKSTQGGNAPMAHYRFTDADDILHTIDVFATGRIAYTAGTYID